MSLFGKLFRGSSRTPAVTYTKDNAGNHIYTLKDHDNDFMRHYRSVFTNGYADANMITLATSIPEVFTAIDIIASRVSTGKFILRDFKTDEPIYDNKQWNKLTEKPNFRQSFEKLIYMFTFYKYACGNRYLFTRNAMGGKVTLDKVSSLQLLEPERTTPHVRASRPKLLYAQTQQEIIDYYDYDKYQDSDKIDSEQVYYDSFLGIRYDPSNPLRGYSPLIADEYPVSNLSAVYISRNVIYVKRGELGFIVSKKTDDSGSVAMTPGEKEKLREEQQRQYGLGHDKSLIAISEVPIDFVRTALSIEELLPFEETYASAAAIFGTLGIPRSFLPTKEGTTFNNASTDDRKLYSSVILPNGAEIARIFTMALNLADDGLYVHADYSHAEALQENKKESAEVNKMLTDTLMTQYEKGVITKNELLIGLGYGEQAGADTYITDGKNPDPMAIKLGVGGLQALKEYQLSGLPPATLKNVFITVFGMSEQDAAKMVEGLPDKPNTPTNEIPAP